VGTKLTKDVEHAIKWLATEYYFLEKLHEALEGAEEHEKDELVIQYFKEGWQDAKQVGRAERIVEADVDKAIANLREARGKSSSQGKINTILEEINIPAAELLKNGSMYTGALRKQLKDIRSKAALQRKYKDKPELGAEVQKEIGDLDIRVNRLIGWIAALEIALKKVKSIKEARQTKSAAELFKRRKQLKQLGIKGKKPSVTLEKADKYFYRVMDYHILIS
jgi:hypothetical protein